MKKHFLKFLVTQSKLIAICATGFILFSCGNSQSGKMGDDEFAVATVNETSIEVRPQVSGFIVKLYVDEGATVRKGQPLFLIDPTQYKAAVDQADAAVKTAESSLRTMELTEKNKHMLFEKQIISSFEYETAVNNLLSARAALAQAKAQLVQAKQNLDFCTVKSPSDGVIGTFPYRIGALVSASIAEPLTTVSEIKDLYVYFSMTEKELLNLTRAGGTLKEQMEKMPAVKLQLADGSMYEFEGKIDAVSGVIDQSTGSVSMRAIFPNTKNVLRSGGMANVIFPYTIPNAILVPQNATVEIQDKKFVYVLQPDSTVKYTEIQISNLNDGKNFIVTDGLKANEKIVIEGVQQLSDGRKIVPITKAQQVAKFQQALKDQREGNLETAFN